MNRDTNWEGLKEGGRVCAQCVDAGVEGRAPGTTPFSEVESG